MKRYLLLLLLSMPVHASDSFSLFLTEEEQSRFNKTISLGAITESKNRLYLKAIMMMDELNWTLWLNNMKITPETCPDYLEILSITPTEVQLVWSKDTEPKAISLKINETIDLDDLNDS